MSTEGLLQDWKAKTDAATDGPRGTLTPEFIAVSRTAMPKLLAAVESVLALHTPGTVMPSRSGLPQCIECSDADSSGPVPWPCPTVRAITDALGGGDDAE